MQVDNHNRVLFNPFLLSKSQPKLLDGKVRRSAGIKLRSSGTIVCSSNQPTWICLFPGYSHVLSFVSTAETGYAPPMFQGHVENGQNRALIQMLRVVSTGLKLDLMNNTDEAEGIWESVRLPVNPDDFVWNQPDGGQLGPLQVMLAGDHDLSSYASYSRGDLKDIHKFLFKLNSVETEHDFNIRGDGVTGDDWNENTFHYDTSFDVILIKVTGRRETLSPSVLMYDSVSNQEVVYVEGSSVGRLMTSSVRDPNFQDVLIGSNLEVSAKQIV